MTASETLKVVGCGALYIATSAALISFNKYLMKEGRFPFAAALVMIHTIVGSCMSLVLYIIKPSLFPSLTDPAKKVTIDRNVILKGAAPIAFFFSVQLVLSNTAYMHLSVAFLQMMKEANIVLVYAFSLVAALEIFSWRHVQILFCVILATSITIHGEMNFSMKGFAIQSIGQIFESCRIVLQALLLTGAGKSFDPLTYQLMVSPLCFVGLASFMGVAQVSGGNLQKLALPPVSLVQDWGWVLLANALIAFALNLAICLFMKHSSAVSFVLAGIVKDCSIVCASALLLNEEISRIQVAGFSVQLGFILIWSLMKKFPADFEDGTLEGLARVLFGKKAPLQYDKKEDYGAVPELAHSNQSAKA